MGRRNPSALVLDARSGEVQQSTKRGISRRKFVQTSAGVVAAGALLGKRAFAAPRPLKIGYVSPETGVLAPFGEADAFVIDEIRKKVQGGIMAGGATRPVEILVRDSQSSPNRAAEVAASLIKSDKVDLMLVAGTADTVNPVADQCEINQVPCVSTDAPWQPYFFGRGGNPAKGFDWTYHFFWGVETIAQVMCDIFDQVPTNKVVGCLLANDVEGNMFADPVKGYPPIFEARGFKVIDPGRFQINTTDFSAQISAFKKANAEILHGVLPLPIFSNFWAQAAQQGYKPKVATIGKASLFPSGVEALGPRGKYLTCELWWSPAYPFKSSLTGQSAKQLCDAYEETHQEAMDAGARFPPCPVRGRDRRFQAGAEPGIGGVGYRGGPHHQAQHDRRPDTMARSSAQPVDHNSRQECLHHADGGRAVGAGKEVDVRLGRGGQPEISSDPRAAQDGAAAGIKNRAQAGFTLSAVVLV